MIRAKFATKGILIINYITNIIEIIQDSSKNFGSIGLDAGEIRCCNEVPEISFVQIIDHVKMFKRGAHTYLQMGIRKVAVPCEYDLRLN